jgi:chaperonin GroES
LENRTFVTHRGVYDTAHWDGINHSGLLPLCDMVLIKVDAGAKQTSGGIIVVDEAKDSTSLGSTTDVLIRSGPQAFAYDADRLLKWEGDRPQPGDRIWFQRYAGQEHFGLDGDLYRIMRDREVAAIEDKEAVAAVAAEPETKIVRAAKGGKR